MLMVLCIEQIQNQIAPCMIDNLNDFVSTDLLPGLWQGPCYCVQAGDKFRLATQMNRKEPVFLAELADRCQAIEDLLKGWFSAKGSTQEYQIYVIIERTTHIFPDLDANIEMSSTLKTSPIIKTEPDQERIDDLPSVDKLLQYPSVLYHQFSILLLNIVLIVFLL